MPSDMQPLGNFVTLVSGSTPSKVNPDFWGGTTPWISAKDMGDFWIEDAEDHLTEAGVAAASRLVQEGTVLLLARGMTLHKRVPICRVTRPSTFNQDVKAVLPKKGLSPRFLPYLLVGNHDRLHERVDSAGHGTGRLNSDALLAFPVRVPSPAEQEGIADIGETIDDRLRLLRQTNLTLEAIACALFKSWFIDFDPVRARCEGRDPDGMSTTAASMFPVEFNDSTLGPIPRGWKVQPFGDFASLAKGSVNPQAFPGQTFEHYSLPAFDVDQLPVHEPAEAIRSNKTRVPQGSVLQSKLNPHIPRVWFTGRVGEQAVCSTEFLPWMAKEGASPEFVYCLLRGSAFEAQVRTLVTGTSNSHQRVRPDQVSALSIVGGTADVRRLFADLVRPMLLKVVENRSQVRALLDVRSTLLPRLLSGKLRLPECQEELREMIA